jgi:hypothetical protein
MSPSWASSGPRQYNSPFSYCIRGLTRGVSEHHRLICAPEMTLPISASPETGSVRSPQQINSLSHPRPRSKVSDTGNSPSRPTSASDAASSLVRSRPPMTSPMFLSRPAERARMDRCQIMTSRPITAAANHYTSHTDTIHMI